MFLLLKPPPTSSSSPPSSLSNGSSLHCFVLETNQRRRSIKLPAAKSKLVLYHSTSSFINTKTQIQKYKEQIYEYRIVTAAKEGDNEDDNTSANTNVNTNTNMNIDTNTKSHMYTSY